MLINNTLRQDINAIMVNDVPTFQNALVANLTEAQLNHFMDDVTREIQQSFEIYGIPYNEDTLKAMMVTLIWTAKATQDMFPGTNNPVPLHRRTPVGYALYGMMQAFPCVNHAIENFEE